MEVFGSKDYYVNGVLLTQINDETYTYLHLRRFRIADYDGWFQICVLL